MPTLTPHEWRSEFQDSLTRLRPHLAGMLKLLAAISMQEWTHQGQPAMDPEEAARRYHERQQPKTAAKRR